MAKHKLFKRALGLAAVGGASYLAVGEFFHSQILSRKAGSLGLPSIPAENILMGIPPEAQLSRWDELMVKIVGGDNAIGNFFAKSYFSIYQEGVKWYLEKKPEKVTTVSSRGARIHADRIVNEKPSNVWAISIHGYSSGPRDMGGIAQMFDAWGYNTLLPHLCGHGESEDDNVSMGWLDRIDILAWIDYLNREYDDPQIILHGISMGGATVMMTTGEPLPDNVVCAIEDCGYSSVWDEFEVQAKDTLHLGSLTPIGLSALDAAVRRHSGFSTKEASSVEQLKKSKTPTLFIHGDADLFVPFWMLQIVYDAAACEKEMLVVPGAEHAEAAYEQELYHGTIKRFIDKYLTAQAKADVSA